MVELSRDSRDSGELKRGVENNQYAAVFRAKTRAGGWGMETMVGGEEDGAAMPCFGKDGNIKG